jgi:hypothetical protein
MVINCFVATVTIIVIFKYLLITYGFVFFLNKFTISLNWVASSNCL